MNIKKILVPFALAFAASPLLLVKTHAVVTNPEYEVGTKAEAFYVEFEKNSNETYEAYYKNKNDLEYTKVDQQLVRVSNDNVRIDVVGLSAGTYSLKLNVGGNFLCELSDIKVKADDRSGYAHWNNIEGVGAYKNDGTLKNGATVIYVDESTKNNVDIDGDGVGDNIALADILKNASSYAPLDVRIIGEIKTKQWDTINVDNLEGSTRKEKLAKYFYNDSTSSKWNTTDSSTYYRLYEDELIKLVSKSNDADITELEGLTNYISYDPRSDKSSYKELDSYFNMLDVKNNNNITIEGIGEDACLFQWGLTFNKCNSIEVKNLTFNNYPEDAVGIEGDKNNVNGYSTYWIHDCTFNQGKNNLDVTEENDKNEGDGSTDFKYARNLTISYCKYNTTHKSNLIGSGNNVIQHNVTLHHNYYLTCESRLPLVRQANIHIYNNYYKGTKSTGISVRAKAQALIENNYFDGKNPFMLAYKVKDSVDPAGTVIKAVNNYYSSNCKTSTSSDSGVGYNEDKIYVLTVGGDSYSIDSQDVTRATQVAVDDGIKTTYTNFDTDATLFYYDSTNNRSNVTVMNDATDLPTLLPEISGAGNFEETTYNFSPNNTELTEIDLGYQTGTYYKGEVQYKAVRFIGIIKYGDAISANDIESINLTIKVYDLDGDVVKTINKEITSVYTELTANDVVVAAKEDNVRYFFSIVNEITSAHIGYRLLCEASISMKLGTNYYASDSYTIA